MPVVINEIVIRTNIDQPSRPSAPNSTGNENISLENVVGQAVEKVLEILKEKEER